MATVRKSRYSDMINGYEFIRSIECLDEKVENIAARITMQAKGVYMYEAKFSAPDKKPIVFYSVNANLFD